MSACFYSANIGDERTLYLSPLTDRKINMSGQIIADPSGYFLYELRGKGDFAEIEILAHLLSDEAALRLKDLLGLR